jgi:hypothetical protein
VIDGSDQGLLPLSEIRNHLPARAGGKRISTETIARWCAKGVGGVVLRSERIGGRRYVSLAALRKFREETNAAHRPPTASANRPSALAAPIAAPAAYRAESIEAAAEALAAHGI